MSCHVANLSETFVSRVFFDLRGGLLASDGAMLTKLVIHVGCSII